MSGWWVKLSDGRGRRIAGSECGGRRANEGWGERNGCVVGVFVFPFSTSPLRACRLLLAVYAMYYSVRRARGMHRARRCWRQRRRGDELWPMIVHGMGGRRTVRDTWEWRSQVRISGWPAGMEPCFCGSSGAAFRLQPCPASDSSRSTCTFVNAAHPESMFGSRCTMILPNCPALRLSISVLTPRPRPNQRRIFHLPLGALDFRSIGRAYNPKHGSSPSNRKRRASSQASSCSI